MTYYISVEWHHNDPDDPIRLFSEIADSGVETRKVEVYRDGRSDFADATSSSGTTRLSESLMPSISEIDDQSEFTATEISPAEFEALWSRTTDPQQ